MEAPLGVLGGVGGGKLKHLGFVKILIKAAMYVLVWLYQYAKEKYFTGSASNLTSILSGFEKMIIALYMDTKFIPRQILSFLDQQVDEHAPPFVKKVLDRTDHIVLMASDICKMLEMQIKLVGPKKAMAIIGTFIKNYLFGSLLPLLGSKLFQFPVLGSMTKMAFSPLSSFSEMYNNSVLNLSTKGIPVLSKLPVVPIPDLTKALDQVAIAPALKDGLNFSEDLTKAFKEVGVAPAENFIGDLTKTIKKVGTPLAEKNESTNIIKDTAADALKQVGLAPTEKADGNIIEGLTNTFKQVALAPIETEKNILQGFGNALKQVGGSSSKGK